MLSRLQTQAASLPGMCRRPMRLSVTETSKRSWFWEPEVVGKHVWKVSPPASLHASADRIECPGQEEKRAPSACHNRRSND